MVNHANFYLSFIFFHFTKMMYSNANYGQMMQIYPLYFYNKKNSLLYFFFVSDINKSSPIEYKTQNSACSTPTKDTLKSYDRTMGMGPVLPPRSTICGPPSHHHYSAPLNFRKGLVSKCTWKCTAIIVIMLSVVLMSTLIYITGKYFFTKLRPN